MWRSARDAEAELRALPNLGKLEALFGLSTFWLRAVYPENYCADRQWSSILRLTPQGAATVAGLTVALKDLPEPDVYLALFGMFSYADLFFDHELSDIARIRCLLCEELRGERIRLPYRYGRLLYERFNDTIGDTRTEHMLSPDVQRLLDGTPQGVCQVGTLLTGPLGVLDSLESRYLPPTLSLPLWHCSDTGCNAVHHVDLIPPQVAVVQAYERIDRLLSQRYGPPSEWAPALQWLHRGFEARDRRSFVDLPLLLADCILGRERTALVEAALLGPSGERLRGTLALPPRRKREGEGPAGELASRLDPETQLQLLLVASDRELISLIDTAVDSGRIRVPLGETRHSFYYARLSAKDSTCELSALGLRSVKHNAVVNLTAAVLQAYQRAGLSNELDWRVRGSSGTSTFDALAEFLRGRGPAEAVRELVLSSAEITKLICEDLQVPFERAKSPDSVGAERLMWKLGFNPMQFDDSISRFKVRLGELNNVLLTSTPITTEEARERVRAAGVNVFVSVEEFIDRLLSFNVWLMSSDHFVGSKFCYSSIQARQLVPVVLGPTLESGGERLTWSAVGENSLGTLLRYLRAAVEWTKGLPSAERASLKRPEGELPHYADDARLRFPFRHCALWADADPGELSRYAEGFGRIAKLVEESDLATVRNGLDHFRERDRFPDAESLLACVARLGQAVELADVQRFLPKVVWLYRRSSTRFGSVEYEFRDHSNRPVFAYGPPLVSGLPRIRYAMPCLMAPGNLLGSPNASLLFHLLEPSEFSAYWQDYPRRRRIPGDERSEGPQAAVGEGRARSSNRG